MVTVVTPFSTTVVFSMVRPLIVVVSTETLLSPPKPPISPTKAPIFILPSPVGAPPLSSLEPPLGSPLVSLSKIRVPT